MTLPVFRAAGAKSNGTTSAVTVAAPSGVATGDLEILIGEVSSGATLSITNTGGSAWSAMTGTPLTVTGGRTLYVWSRIRQAGDGNPQVTASADQVCACRLAYTTGTFDTSNPFEIETTGTETTSDTSYSFAPGTSTGGSNRLVLSVSTILRDSNVASVPVCTNANLTSLASRADYCTNSGNGGGFGVTEGTRVAAGAVGTFACTYAVVAPKAYISFAIKPSITNVAVTQGTETETSQAVAWAPKKRLADQTAETELAQAVGKKKSVSPVQATEAETAQVVAWAPKKRLADQTAETELAQTVARVKRVALAQATETDSAGIITAPTAVAVGQAVESELGQILASRKIRGVLQASESELAQAIAPSEGHPVGQSFEADLAQPFSAVKYVAVSQTNEAEQSQPCSSAKLAPVSQVSETELAQLFGHGKTVHVVQAGETDLAQSVVEGGAAYTLVDVLQAAEADMAQAITPGGSIPIPVFMVAHRRRDT